MGRPDTEAMGLTLKIISYQRHSLERKEFLIPERGSATIGRGSGNDWVLPDPERLVSNRHCVIQARDDGYYITDTSTNGIYVNKYSQRMGRDESRRLEDGDQLQIGEFELQVAIDLPAAATRAAKTEPVLPAASTARSSAQVSGQPELADRRIPAQEFSAEAPAPGAVGSSGTSELASPGADGGTSGAALGDRGGAADAEDDSDTNSQEVAPGSDPASKVTGQDPSNPQVIRSQTPYSAESEPELEHPAAAGASTVADLESLSPSPQPSEPAPTPSATAVELDAALRAFLQGAGVDKLDAAGLPPERVLMLAGQQFRLMVQGLMELLMSRSNVKGGFRIQQTTLQPSDNNPLKFSLSVEDAMRALLNERETRNLSGEQAVTQVVRDLKVHQVAVIAGMQAALHHLLERFDPAAIEAQVDDPSLLECMVPGARKAHNWDYYARFYGEMLRQAEDDFQDLFARQFVRAYEEQIRKL